MREKNTCPGCLCEAGQETQKSKCRVSCKIKNCEKLSGGKMKYCSAKCDSYPCARLKHMDKRYRSKYGMSTIENLNAVAELGIKRFVQLEKEKWTCPKCGELICVHKPTCVSCGYKWQ
jgi:hypothetical protein